MKEKSVHPYFMPDRDGLKSTLDLKCCFEGRWKLLPDVLLSAPGLIFANRRTSGVISHIAGNPI